MELTRHFARVRFPSSVIEDATNVLSGIATAAEQSAEPAMRSFSVTRNDETWRVDDINEWYAEYDRPHSTAFMSLTWGMMPQESRLSISVTEGIQNTEVSITAPDRRQVEETMRVFSSVWDQHRLPELVIAPIPPEPPIVVFIGHGHSSDWRRVKDQLQDSHGYKVEAYEVGERAGHSIRDVLDSMLLRSSFALLMMTAEDEIGNGQIRARQNVVHEAGLFQGRLGFNRAIAVVEEGVEVFSNLSGVDQIRYPSGHVDAAVSRVLATLRREFGDRR